MSSVRKLGTLNWSMSKLVDLLKNLLCIQENYFVVEISCRPPPSVFHGYFTGNSYHAGDMITLNCNTGYYIPGGRNIFRCSVAGVWSERTRMICFGMSTF